MAKETAKEKAEIVSGVRLSDEKGRTAVYVPGMEAELAEVISQKEIDHLTEQGAITGDWTPKKKEAAKDAK